MSSADRLADNFATTVQMQGKPGQIKPRSIAKYVYAIEGAFLLSQQLF